MKFSIKHRLTSLFTLALFVCCSSNPDNYTQRAKAATNTSLKEKSKTDFTTDTSGITIDKRYKLNHPWQRTSAEAGSFAAFLRQLPLKPYGSPVLYFNGKEKQTPGVYDSVLDLDIGNKDLQQCADAIIRLRADYLFENARYEDIHFNLTNGFKVEYNRWRKGERVMVNGNKTWWEPKTIPSENYYPSYLEFVFMYAGTLSLSKELRPVSIKDIQMGDVFIQGGSPGHAVIVMDTAINTESGEKIFLLAQSYMPAQDIQILHNPSSPERSPWYAVDFGEELTTPEWTFKKTDLKRFPKE
ncbi:DUF4846 domain-containing protein [Cytophagaceae bacterium ABcell3]|nr:DUF4846 domain-containing protein [Cytophagaceae bacterium ABcell3]